MFTPLFINIFFIFIICTFINLVIKCYYIFVDRMNNFLCNYFTYSVSENNKIVHHLHFSNMNKFFYWNKNIFNHIFDTTNSYLKNYYKSNINLYILVFSYNRKNNTYSLISNITEINYSPNLKDNLTSIIINKSIVNGNRDILIVVKEI